MLSSSTRSAPASSASRAARGSRPRPRRAGPASTPRTASNASATPPAATTWLSLTSAASDSDIRWLTPPPQRTAYFSSARRPGVVLRVSRTAAPVPVDRVDPAAGQRRDAGEVAEQVQRGALGGEQGAGAARSRSAARRRGATRSPSARGVRRRRRPHRADDLEDRLGDRQPGDDAGGAGDEVGGRALVGRHGRADVTSTPPARSSARARADQRLDRVRRRARRRSAGRQVAG